MPVGSSAQGSAIGAGVGSIVPGVGAAIGSVIGGILGGNIGNLFSHKASGKTLNRVYNEMRDWARDLVTLEEFTALESNRQAGFFATDVVPTISDRINTLTGNDSIESYRAWSHANYKPNVQVLTDRLLDYKAAVISGAVSTPTAQGAVTTGTATPGVKSAPPTTPGEPSQAGFKLPTWAIFVFVGIVLFVLFKGFK